MISGLPSTFIGQVVDTTPGATTMELVNIAPHVSPSNKLNKIQPSGSNLLGKMRSSSQRLSCSWQEVETTPSAATLGVVDIAPHVSPSNKLDRIRSSGSNLLGENAIIIAAAVMLMARSRFL
jgi:hypothetical protein